MNDDQLDIVAVGERLRMARENASYTQADAAEFANLSRTTLVAIEKGQRKIKMPELKKLTGLYNVSMNSILRDEAVHVDLIPRFRRQTGTADDLAIEAAEILSQLAKAEAELEGLLGVQQHQNHPPERPILPGDVKKQAENDALELRQWLGLGLSPIQDIISILEHEIGVRLFVRKFKGNIAGLFVYEDSLGACILLNGNHRKERRTHTAAHELGHFISARKMPEVYFEDDPMTSREERYANAFASAFLMPSRSILKRFEVVTAGSEQFTRRHIIMIAHSFGVSREAVVRRLEELGAIKRGTWDWFEMNGGITDQQAAQVLGDRLQNSLDQRHSEAATSLRLNSLICRVWKDGLLSEGQLNKLLGISRLELREILDDQELDGSDATDAPSLFD